MKIRQMISLLWLITILVILIIFVDPGFLMGVTFIFIILGAIIATVFAVGEVWDWLVEKFKN